MKSSSHEISDHQSVHAANSMRQLNGIDVASLRANGNGRVCLGSNQHDQDHLVHTKTSFQWLETGVAAHLDSNSTPSKDQEHTSRVQYELSKRDIALNKIAEGIDFVGCVQRKRQ